MPKEKEARAKKPKALGPKSFDKIPIGTMLIRWNPPADGFAAGGYIPQQLTFVSKNKRSGIVEHIGLGRVHGGLIDTSMMFGWDSKRKLWRWNLWPEDNDDESYRIGLIPKSVTQKQMSRWNAGFGDPF